MGKRLTDLACKNTACEGQAIKKMADGDNLYLWVYPNGAKYWRFRYKFQGKPNNISLGVYPKVSLVDARRDARDKRNQLDQGLDPSAVRKQEVRAAKLAAADDFETIGMEWYEKNKSAWSVKHAKDVLRRLKVNLFPDLGARPISEIDGPELLATIEKMEKRGAIDLAHRMCSNAGEIFRYGIATGRCKYDVAASLRGALAPNVHKNHPAVKPEQLPDLMRKIAAYDQIGDRKTQLAVKLMAHTFLRTTEMILGEWTEFNFDDKVWAVPGPRMKMENDHLVPLTDQVIAILEELRGLSRGSIYILPGRNIFRTISNNTILNALYLMGYKGSMTGHGFRAVASTILNESGLFNPDWIERQLAHVEENKVRGAYNRAMYLKDRREMMVWWSNYLDEQEKKKPRSIRSS